MNKLGRKQTFKREKFKGKINIYNPYEYKNKNINDIDEKIYNNPILIPHSPIYKKKNIKDRDNTLKIFELKDKKIDPVEYRKSLFNKHNHQRATFSSIFLLIKFRNFIFTNTNCRN